MPKQLEPVQIRTGTNVGDIPAVIDVGGGVPGFPAVDGSLLTNVGGGGTGAGAAVNPGELMYGTRLDYANAQGSSSAGRVQYVRVRLAAGVTIKGMQTFVVNAAPGAAKNIRFGIYSQTDPINATLGPNTKVRETAAVNVAGTTNSVVYQAFTAGNYVVPQTGYYWLAIVQDSASITYAVAPSIHPGFLNAAFESPGVTAVLPATSGVTTNPANALLYVAGVEDI